MKTKEILTNGPINRVYSPKVEKPLPWHKIHELQKRIILMDYAIADMENGVIKFLPEYLRCAELNGLSIDQAVIIGTAIIMTPATSVDESNYRIFLYDLIPYLHELYIKIHSWAYWQHCKDDKIKNQIIREIENILTKIK